MDYREILKQQLQQRQEMNPKYSLRAFAMRLGISASKMSEVLSGKKRLSVPRAEEISEKLKLSGLEKELFVLSVQIESSSKGTDRKELRKQMEELKRQFTAQRTSQRNAWYFGAIKALQEYGHDAGLFRKVLGLTELQVENAQRFLKRITKIYPDRKNLAIEPASVLRKIEESFYSKSGQVLEAEFLLLSSKDQDDLERKIRSLIKSYSVKSRNTSPEDLKMIYWGSLNLKEE